MTHVLLTLATGTGKAATAISHNPAARICGSLREEEAVVIEFEAPGQHCFYDEFTTGFVIAPSDFRHHIPSPQDFP
jgi:hypothetical protein